LTSTYVVIVNYRTGPLVVDCLASLAPELPALRGGRVVVVDNASGDDSMACIGAAIDANGWGAWAEVIALPRNGGFAYGNNRAIERVREHDPAFAIVVCLNPDAVVRPGALDALVQQLEGSVDAGIAGASVEDEHGVPQRSAHAFPSPLGELDGAARLGLLSRLIAPPASPGPATTDAPRRCDWVSGACFAIRRQVLDSIGPLDEGYFLYFEETDFCLRARQAGWSCWFVPNARVVHREGSSTGIRDRTRRRPAYWFASRRRFLIKAHGVAGLAGADLLWALGHVSLVLRRAVGLGRGNRYARDPARFARDLLIGDARAILRGEASAILSGTLREPGSVSEGNA
jgi:N-acetylglucosaminyl-diphospho-decaprenol L-rhamnosyltransferase